MEQETPHKTLRWNNNHELCGQANISLENVRRHFHYRAEGLWQNHSMQENSRFDKTTVCILDLISTKTN